MPLDDHLAALWAPWQNLMRWSKLQKAIQPHRASRFCCPAQLLTVMIHYSLKTWETAQRHSQFSWELGKSIHLV